MLSTQCRLSVAEYRFAGTTQKSHGEGFLFKLPAPRSVHRRNCSTAGAAHKCAQYLQGPQHLATSPFFDDILAAERAHAQLCQRRGYLAEGKFWDRLGDKVHLLGLWANGVVDVDSSGVQHHVMRDERVEVPKPHLPFWRWGDSQVAADSIRKNEEEVDVLRLPDDRHHFVHAFPRSGAVHMQTVHHGIDHLDDWGPGSNHVQQCQRAQAAMG
mmetsp:Transcript_36598/g.49998  ORF Transcript_36598/g.49998 Transcript_36598/m.49998 type:complete len:213 (-) Transcript_36598:31-669(-)